MSVTSRRQGRGVFDTLHINNRLTVGGLDVVLAGVAAMGGDVWYADSSKTSSGTGKTVAQAKHTMANAIAAAGARDAILMLPGRYTEGDLTIARAKGPLTVIGLGGRGAAYIQPSVAATAGLDVRADDVTLVNVGVAGADTAAAHALKVFGSRFRAHGCKIEGAAAQVIVGPGTVAQEAAATHGVGADVRLEDCEICWGTDGVRVVSSNYGPCTQILVRGCLLHNLTGDMIDEDDAGVVGAGRDIWIIDNDFAVGEDGTAPTRFIDLDSVDTTGLVARNVFETTVHASALIALASGVLYVGNHTQAEAAAAGFASAASGRPD